MTKATQSIVLYTSLKAINAAIKDTATRGVSLQQDLHKLACSVLAHVGKHKDVRVVDSFIASVPDMVRVNSLKMWFEKFGQIAFTDSEGKAMKTCAFVGSKKTLLGDAMLKPFWSFKAKEGEAYVAIKFDDWSAAQIRKLEKDAKETGRNYNALITALKTFNPDTAVAN